MTQVVFRVFPEGDVIAIFPELVWDYDGNLASYQRVGQHGAASPDLLTDLRAATEGERADLLRELVHLVGYDDLEVLS